MMVRQSKQLFLDTIVEHCRSSDYLKELENREKDDIYLLDNFALSLALDNIELHDDIEDGEEEFLLEPISNEIDWTNEHPIKNKPLTKKEIKYINKKIDAALNEVNKSRKLI